MGSDYPRGTYENVVYHFHGTIQIIIPSYLRPVGSNRAKQNIELFVPLLYMYKYIVRLDIDFVNVLF